MANLQVTSEDQIQRLNNIFSKVQQLQELGLKTITESPSAKSWSIVEVIQHLNIAYAIYRPKLIAYLKEAADSESGASGFKVRPWQKMMINMQRPKGNVRKWKMKTLKRFEPVLDTSTLDEDVTKEIFAHFFEAHQHLKRCILDSRSKNVHQRTITSAIGPVVKFYLPEAFEFLICHLERHMVQIDLILEQQAVST